MSEPTLSKSEKSRLNAVAVTLIPGDGKSPSAAGVPEFDELLSNAATAIGRELDALREAIRLLPDEITWPSVSQFATEHATEFELVSTVVAGAYFMSTDVLESLGYPTGARSAAPFDLAADELASGILEPVLSRGSRTRIP